MKTTLVLVCLISLVCPSNVIADSLPISGKSSVVIVLEQIPPGPPRNLSLSVEDTAVKGKPAPNGTVFDIPSRHDASFRFRIENFNTLKYAVKETPTAVEEPKLTLPDIFTKALEGLATKPRTISDGTEDPAWKKSLDEFDEKAKDINLFKKAVEETGRLIRSEDSHGDFLKKLAKIEGPPVGWYEEDKLDGEIKACKTDIDMMVVLSIALNHYSEVNPKNLTYKYAAREAVSVAAEAVEFQKHLDEIQKTITAYVQHGGATVFTYTSSKATEFKGGKLSIKLEIFMRGDVKQDNPIYRLDFEIASENKTFFDATAGVFFISARDETFNLRDRTTNEINPSASPNNIIVRNGPQDSLGVNFGAMIHYGYKLRSNVGAAFGLGLATGNNRYSFFLGPSLVLGSDRKFWVSGGYALASVKRLKDYNEDDRFTGAASDIPTDYRYKSGYFLGISYKF